MATYQIINTASGHVLGVYEGVNERSAIQEMLDDGYAPDAEPDPDVQGFPVDLNELEGRCEDAGYQVQRAENGTFRLTSADGGVRFFNREEWLWPLDVARVLEAE